jgi:hypothetical protein
MKAGWGQWKEKSIAVMIIITAQEALTQVIRRAATGEDSMPEFGVSGGHMTKLMRRELWQFGFVLILLALVCSTGRGQATVGSIRGLATDSTGAVIPGATVIATDEDKGVTFRAVSDATGNYTLLNLTPGNYTVAASASGFAEERFRHVVLAIDEKAQLNFELKVSGVSATVEVNDAPPVLQSQTAEVGTVIGGDAITDLPLFGRNFYDLTSLVPGVNTGNGSNMNAFNLSVSGQREYANSVQLDGIESTGNRTQDITVTPNVDSVQEFKVVTSNFNAEFGNASGGVVAIQTKAGSNAFHGDAFEFYRPPWMAARQTIPGVGTPQPEATLRQNNYGGTFGGPVIKNRSFFFGAYERMQNHDTWNYVTSTIPFQLFNIQPNGDVDFSTLVDPCSGQQCKDSSGNPSGPAAGTVDPIFDPNVAVANYGWWATQFPGNVIPASRVSTAGMNTMKNFFPKPNLPGIENGWFRNFQAHTPVQHGSNQVDTRFDQVITSKDRLYAVYHWQNYDYLAHDAFFGQDVVPGAGDADQATNEDSGAQSLSLTYDRTFTPTALNEIRFGYLNDHQNQYSLLNGTDYSTKYGFGNVNVPGYAATVGYPQIYMADGYLAGGSTWKPFHVRDVNYEIDEAFTWVGIPRHEIKVGAQIRLLNSHPDFSLFPTGFDYFGSYGNAETSAQAWWGYYYCADPTWCVDQGYNWLGGSDVADLVLGLPLDVYMGLQLTTPHTQSWNMDYFVQDSFKVTPRVTLNYGLRFAYENPWTEAGNSMSNFDLASGDILLAGRGGNSNSLIKGRKDDISPRVGIAFSADPKTVLRAGGGVFFSPENDGREDYLTKNNPFALQYSFSNWEFNVAPTSPQVWPYQLDAGSPRSTTINAPTTGRIHPQDLVNGNLENTFAINPVLKTGTTGSFNVAIERQLSRTMALDVTYVGAVSRHLSYEVGDINADPNLGSSGGNYDGRVSQHLGIIQYLTDVGTSNYHSLQVKLTRQMSRSTSFLASYTYGHSLDNGPAPFDLGNNNDRPQNPYDLRSEYGTSDSDVRHNFVFSGDYRLPFGQGEMFGSKWASLPEAVLGGWRFGTIVSMHTGTPVNIILGDDPKSALAGVRPNVTGTPNLSRGKRNVLEYFNTSAFSAPAVPQGSSYAYGNAGRNLVVGPGYINVDASLAKDFKVENRWTLQVRAEAFNGLNSVHYSNPDGDFSSGTFGEINYTQGDPRRAQLAAKFIF